MITYALAGNDLSVACSGFNCPALETPLSQKIISFTADVQGNLVGIDLVGRYDPTKPVSGTRFANPQVEVKTQIICNSSSTH